MMTYTAPKKHHLHQLFWREKGVSTVLITGWTHMLSSCFCFLLISFILLCPLKKLTFILLLQTHNIRTNVDFINADYKGPVAFLSLTKVMAWIGNVRPPGCAHIRLAVPDMLCLRNRAFELINTTVQWTKTTGSSAMLTLCQKRVGHKATCHSFWLWFCFVLFLFCLSFFVFSVCLFVCVLICLFMYPLLHCCVSSSPCR